MYLMDTYIRTYLYFRRCSFSLHPPLPWYRLLLLLLLLPLLVLLICCCHPLVLEPVRADHQACLVALPKP